jgi:hypothetical protein
MMLKQKAAYRNRAQLNLIANNISSRLQHYISVNNPSLPSGCLPTDSSNGYQEITSFRRFQPGITPPLVTWSYSAGSGTGSGNKNPSNCLISASEKSKLANLTVILEPLAPPDMESLTLPLQISINATSMGASTGPVKAPKSNWVMSNKFILKVGSLSSYSLVLLNPLSTEVQVSTQSSSETRASFEVLGSTYYVGSPRLESIVSVTAPSPPTVYFNGSFDVHDDYLTSSGDTLNLANTSRIFRGGIRTGIFGNAPLNNLPVPSTSGTTDLRWQQKLDYSYVYGPSGPGVSPTAAKYYPLPDVASALGNSSALAMAGFPPVNDPYLNSNAESLTSVPTSNGILPYLSQTCRVDPSTTPIFVFQRANQDFTINFDDSSMDPNSNNYVFCGVIVSKSVTIRTPSIPSSTSFAIYGIIVTQKINVTGSGKVLLLNPAESTSIPNMQLPSYQTQRGIYASIQSIATSYGHNLFIPIFEDADYPSFSYSGKYGPFLPHPPVINPPISRIGYMAKCSGAGAAPYYCLDSSLAPDYDVLFSGSPFADNLSFSLQVTH